MTAAIKLPGRSRETVMPNTSSNPTTFRRLRRCLTSTLLAVGVFAGTIAGTAQPAHAAGSVMGCFIINGSIPAYPLRVQLLVWMGGAWRVLNDGYRLTNGCVTIPVTLGYYNYPVALYVYDGNYGGTFYGWSAFYDARPGTHYSPLGIGTLSYTCTGIVNAC